MNNDNGLGELWDIGITDEPFPMDIPDPLEQAPATNEEAGFWSTVQKFREKADEFWTAYKRLEELEPIAMQTPDTAASYNRVMSGGNSITSTIESAADTVKGAIGWAGNLFGVDTVKQKMQLSALGIWPIALLAAAVAAIAVWLSDAYVEINKLESIKTLVKEGTSPQQASDIVRAGGGGFGTAFGAELGKGLAFAAIAGFGIWFLLRRG